MAPQHVFWIASGLVLVALILGIIFLREPQHAAQSLGMQEQTSSQRSLAAQASLRNIVTMASAARAERQNQV